ncbi:hypothetical protein JCM3766R1_003225 [Sporobolomyces carnicolor]
MKSRTESTRSRRDDDDDDAGVEGFFRDGSDNEHRGLLQTQTPSALHPSENDEDEEDNEDRDDNGSEKDAIPARMSSATRSTLTTPGGNHDRQSRHDRQKRKQFIRETFRETVPVFFLVLIGAILTGQLLDRLQSWRVFIRIEELFILVPILLNLKGNLEMNLAARFSTSAQIGELDLRRTRRALVLGNLALLQVQALIVSLISGLLAFLLGLASRNGVHHGLQHPFHKGMIGTDDQGNDLRGGYFEALLVLCVSMLAASISSGVLGSFMCGLVVLCRRFKVNPDNVSTPIAAVLGDVVTLIILGGLASLFAKFMGTIISTLVFLCLVVAIVVNLYITFRNAYVQELLSVGWAPLFIAMAISSGTGVVLETYVNAYTGFSLLAPIFTALSAAPASIFVARTTTILHSSSSYLTLAAANSHQEVDECEKDRREAGRGAGARRAESFWFTGVVLGACGAFVMEMAWLFGWTTGQVPRNWVFGLAYTIVACVQTLIGLVIARQGSMLLWRFDYDPDVYALPLLSSFLDVSGQLLLVVAFEVSKKFAGGGGGDSAGAEAAASATSVAAPVATALVERAARLVAGVETIDGSLSIKAGG